jgi:dGTPase
MVTLAGYATDAAQSRGRLHPEPPCPMRTPFQRDRDRIVHATAFRRLTHKTQVFLYHEGDHYRTRLTHSIEVAQIARALARMLGLDQDLTEALALAHDFGHPPFGHAGERALDAAMASHGGFDHNAQTLRVVTRLERKYAAFDGLNLSIETLDGLIKHNGPVTGPAAAGMHELLRAEIVGIGLDGQVALDTFAGAEAQAAAIADDIAYNNHDLEDGVRAGLITLDDLAAVPLAGPFVARARAKIDDPDRRIYEVNRTMITAMIADIVAHARHELARRGIATPGAIAAAGAPVVTFSPAMAEALAGLKVFLFERVYRHARVMRVMSGAEAIVADLHRVYLAEPARMPAAWARRTKGKAPAEAAQIVTDFVSGMTDRFAVEAHRQLFDATPDLR